MALRRRWGWLLLLALLGFGRAALYAQVVPPWQGPDEPGHFEYVWLMARLGRAPGRSDADPAIEREILRSMARTNYWQWVRRPTPATLPERFADDPWLRRAGPQIGAESPLYYVPAAWLVRLTPGWGAPVEAQVRTIRLFSAGLFGLMVLAAGVASSLATRQRFVQWAVPMGLALAPMPAFAGALVNNDSLANFAGALFAATVAALWPKRWGVREIALLVVVAGLAVAAKRTGWFIAPALPLLIWLHGRRAVPAPQTRLSWRRLWPAAAAGAAIVAALAWPAMETPGGWRVRGAADTPVRWRADAAARTGRYGLLVRDDRADARALASQTLAPRYLAGLGGEQITAQVWVRSDGAGVPACIVLDDGAAVSQSCASVGEAWQPLEVSHTLPTAGANLRVALGVGRRDEFGPTGTYYADDLVVTAAGRGPLPVSNPGFEAPASLGGRWLNAVAVRFGWPEGLWASWTNPASFAPAPLQRYLRYAALTFAHFWGVYGWLQLPLPIAWYVVMAGVSIVALAGLIRRRVRPSGWPPGLFAAFSVLALLAAVAVYAPMVGQVWQPQGRYLFPALVPFLMLLCSGLGAWLPRRASHAGARAALLAWGLLLFALDQVSIWSVLYPTYYT